jgi:hypothetical protein
VSYICNSIQQISATETSAKANPFNQPKKTVVHKSNYERRKVMENIVICNRRPNNDRTMHWAVFHYDPPSLQFLDFQSATKIKLTPYEHKLVTHCRKTNCTSRKHTLFARNWIKPWKILFTWIVSEILQGYYLVYVLIFYSGHHR